MGGPKVKGLRSRVQGCWAEGFGFRVGTSKVRIWKYGFKAQGAKDLQVGVSVRFKVIKKLSASSWWLNLLQLLPPSTVRLSYLEHHVT